MHIHNSHTSYDSISFWQNCSRVGGDTHVDPNTSNKSQNQTALMLIGHSSLLVYRHEAP